MGQLFAYLAPTAAVATVLGSFNHFLWNIFNGFLVPSPIMAKGWVWLNYSSATTYVIHSLAASQLGDNDRKIVLQGFSGAPAPPPLSCYTMYVGLMQTFSCNPVS
jgi:ABC-type multidrug transport system permease subunit